MPDFGAFYGQNGRCGAGLFAAYHDKGIRYRETLGQRKCAVRGRFLQEYRGRQSFVPGTGAQRPVRVKGGSPYRVKGETPCPVRVDACVNSYWVLPDADSCRTGSFPACFPPGKFEKRREDSDLKLTRHNGRSGKHGAYNPRHNDRRFDVENSEHIDLERGRKNVYWDCYRGYTTLENREDSSQPDFSFEQIERIYYTEKYAASVNAQNARNEKTRHTERNRTVEDLLKNNKTCPEESIYQIGTVEQSVPAETLVLIVGEFYEEFERRFGSHVHLLDWALHLDEGTPHIHERHVFDCENRYGELFPQQEKALEELGIPLPNPDKPKGKHNNRKQTFDSVCRTLLFDISRRHGVHLEQEPSYGGRSYLEKQDYILMKQKEQMAVQEEKLEELTVRVSDVESLIEEVSDTAYEKAVEVVTDQVREQTQLEDLAVIEKYRKSVTSPQAKNSPETIKIANTLLERVQERLRKSAGRILERVQAVLQKPEVRQEGKRQIQEKAKESVRQHLKKAQEEAARREQNRRKPEQRKQDMER